MKKRALELVDILEGSEVPTDTEIFEASAMIRRLVEELDRQGEPDYFILTQDHTWLSCDEDFYNKAKPTHRMKCYTTPQTKPLSDEEIEKLYEESYLPIGSQEWEFDCVVFARAIEERHGIK